MWHASFGCWSTYEDSVKGCEFVLICLGYGRSRVDRNGGGIRDIQIEGYLESFENLMRTTRKDSNGWFLLHGPTWTHRKAGNRGRRRYKGLEKVFGCMYFKFLTLNKIPQHEKMLKFNTRRRCGPEKNKRWDLESNSDEGPVPWRGLIVPSLISSNVLEGLLKS